MYGLKGAIVIEFKTVIYSDKKIGKYVKRSRKAHKVRFKRKRPLDHEEKIR